MNRLILFAVLLFTTALQLQAQEMKFAKTELDYGNIEKGANGEREFKFTNVGSAPVVITNAQASCGCTVPSFPKEPIMPGESASIKVKYDTNRVGGFTKDVTLTSNDKTNPTLRLRIYGNVEEEAPATPTPSKSLFSQ